MAQFIGEFMYHKYGLHTLTDYHLTYVPARNSSGWRARA